MSVIKILDKSIANKIAAGEVVERPSSVVKELVENAMDAGAQNITVEIQNGGTTYIRVTDDGCGMSQDDAKIAFVRHATSKISSENDLGSISTFGFRGEALAAISAVSRIELVTMQESEQLGTRILLEGGVETLCESAGTQKGTTIIVRDLFYNTPARMKFLKKDATEAANIAAVIDHLAVGNSNISFTFINNGKAVLQTDRNGNLLSTIYSVFGKEISENLLPIERSFRGVRVYGYVGKPSFSRANRNIQLFYINNRFVRSKTFVAALDQAYKNLLMNGRFAVCFIFVDMPAEMVDVNVHPAKMEVKFSNDHVMFESVYYAVKDALNAKADFADEVRSAMQQTESVIVSDDDQQKVPLNSYLTSKESIPQDKVDFSVKSVDFAVKSDEFIVSAPKKTSADFDVFSEPSTAVITPQINQQAIEYEQQTISKKQEVYFKYIGEVFDTYIIIQTEDSFYLVDKHAAHERMIFERMLKAYQSGEKFSQQLIDGITVSLTQKELDIAVRNKSLIEKLGFEFEQFGVRDVIIRSVPFSITPDDAAGSFIELLSIIHDKNGVGMLEIEQSTLKMLSCKSAIKAGFKNTRDELEPFIKQVLEDKSLNFCPHGRPIFCEYTKAAVEKAFKRVL